MGTEVGPRRSGAGRAAILVVVVLAVGLVAIRLESQTAAVGVVADRNAATPVATVPVAAVPSTGASTSPASVGPSTASPSGVAALAPFIRPATVDGPVPSNLLPRLATAARDYPQPYLDGCHVEQDGQPAAGTCLYAASSSKTTIVLFGDSHALSWFPAVERVANREGWRLLNLTMSACSPATITNWNPSLKRASTACSSWRAATIARLVRARPQMVLLAGTRGFSAINSAGTVLVGDARTEAWRAGMKLTLAPLVKAAGKVIVIGDTPISLQDPPVCLAQHPKSVLACATPVSRAINAAWLDEERAAAQRSGAGFIDPSPWVCPSSPCPVVIGRFLVFRNPGHLTATFAKTLYDRLGAAIRHEVATLPAPAVTH